MQYAYMKKMHPNKIANIFFGLIKPNIKELKELIGWNRMQQLNYNLNPLLWDLKQLNAK